MSDCVCIIVCLFIAYEYACNFGIGSHFQKPPKVMSQTQAEMALKKYRMTWWSPRKLGHSREWISHGDGLNKKPLYFGTRSVSLGFQPGRAEAGAGGGEGTHRWWGILQPTNDDQITGKRSSVKTQFGLWQKQSSGKHSIHDRQFNVSYLLSPFSRPYWKVSDRKKRQWF